MDIITKEIQQKSPFKKYKTYSMDLKKELIEKVIMKNIIIH